MRSRLVLAIAGVAVAAVVVLAVPLGIVLARTYRDDELLRLQRDTIGLTRQVDLAAPRGDPVELPRTGDLLGVYDRSGRLVAGRGPSAAPPVVRVVLRRARPADETGGGRLVVAVPLLTNERVSGAVRAERSDAAAARDARGAWLVIGAIAVGIIALAVLAAVLLGRRLAAPLERLALSARRLGDGDFSVRAFGTGVAEVDAVASALNATAQRLDDLISRERAFSADASHQLRTPLQALRIELEAIELRGQAPPELPAALAQVDRLQATIDTLLSVARDSSRTTAVTDLGAVLADVESRWRGRLAADGRPIRVAIDDGATAARGSALVVNEILDVLVGNAFEHGAGLVTVTGRRIDAHVSVDVADEGSGFSVDPENAFARRTGAGVGHGIGLALAQSLAHAEGGRIVVSRSGPGAVVRLLLRTAAPP